jgi:hypothetical protein
MRSFSHLNATVVLRPAAPRDAASVDRLARLDSARRLRGPVLLAELDGVPVAALERRSGRVVADPFVLTAGVQELLRLAA